MVQVALPHSQPKAIQFRPLSSFAHNTADVMMAMKVSLHMLESLCTDEPIAFYVQSLQEQMKQLEIMRDVTLRLSVTQEQAEQEMTVVDLNYFLANLRESLRVQCGHEIKVQMAECETPVRINMRLLYGALFNLVKYCLSVLPYNGQLCVLTQVSKHHVTLTLMGDGLYLPPQLMERVKQFYDNHSTYQHDVDEKGLYLAEMSILELVSARRTLEMHGGQLGQAAVSGNGAFIVRLPLKDTF